MFLIWGVSSGSSSFHSCMHSRPEVMCVLLQRHTMYTCSSMLVLILITWLRCSPIYPYNVPPTTFATNKLSGETMQIFFFSWKFPLRLGIYCWLMPNPKFSMMAAKWWFPTFTTSSTFIRQHSAFYKQESFFLPTDFYNLFIICLCLLTLCFQWSIIHYCP